MVAAKSLRHQTRTHMHTAFHFLISKRTPSPLGAAAGLASAAAGAAGASTAISSVFPSAGAPAERPSPVDAMAMWVFHVCAPRW